jgi:hypothetical protein
MRLGCGIGAGERYLRVMSVSPEYSRPRGSAQPSNLRATISERKVAVVIRQRGGESLPGVFRSEAHALSWVRHRVVKSTVSSRWR